MMASFSIYFCRLLLLIFTYHSTEIACTEDDIRKQADFRIIGGEPAKIEEFYYQVVVFTSVINDTYMCGGSIIAPNRVLTAAHCVLKKNSLGSQVLVNATDVVVFGGSANISELVAGRGQRCEVRKIIPHQSYSPNRTDHDIAILELSSNFTMNTTRPIEMRTTSTLIGENCTVSGWGTTSIGGNISYQLLKTVVPIFNHNICKVRYGYSVSDTMICAGYEIGGKDSCQGDSGGPLVCNNELTGVVGFGTECALPGYPGVYMEVAKYHTWILNNSINSTDPPPTTNPELANIADVPYQTYIEIATVSGTKICGGAVYGTMDRVLTAAHCVISGSSPVQISNITVKAGSVDSSKFSTQGQTATVKEIIIHQNYSDTSQGRNFNIAILVLSRKFTSPVRPASLPIESSTPNQMCTISGWGTMRIPNNASTLLLKANIPIFNQTRCRQLYGNATDNVICAGYDEGGKYLCQGDSGGPLYCNDRLAGIVSLQSSCASSGYPETFMNVAKFREWILNSSIDIPDPPPTINPELANIADVPYQAYIEITTVTGTKICGGAVYGTMDRVLTAAHCVISGSSPVQISNITVKAGSVDSSKFSTQGQTATVKEIIIHQNYSDTSQGRNFNIAILVLSRKFTSPVRPASLPIESSTPNQMCTISGWGTMRIPNNASTLLLKANIPIFNQTRCRQLYGNATDNVICAGYDEGGKYLCQGDSGGPLYCNDRLAGIVSLQSSCASSGYPETFMNVAKFREWILNSSIDIPDPPPTINPELANIADVPYQAYIEITTVTGTKICGGAVYGTMDRVLTAAHCVISGSSPVQISNITVKAGSVDSSKFSTQGQTATVKEIIIHQNYSDTSQGRNFNIAILVLSRKFTSPVRPASLPIESFTPSQMCTISGWGTMRIPNNASTLLLKANIPIFNQTRCRQLYGNATDNVICAGYDEGGKYLCQGDSGGPLYCNDRLAGIVSLQSRCAPSGYPETFMNVAKFREWIDKNSAAGVKSSILNIMLMCILFFLKYK